MFLVVNTSGKVWDGFSWGERGKVFCTAARALRSLHEEGEDWDEKMLRLAKAEK